MGFFQRTKHTLTPVTKPPSSSTAEKNAGTTTATRKRFLRPLIAIVLIVVVLVAWLLINNSLNSTDPSVAGRPLSNPHTHLHTIALGGRSGVIYLGTHYSMFTSTDGGHTWPQSRGVLNTMMITAIAVDPATPDIVGVMAIPVSGIGVQSGAYFSHDGGASWHASAPSGLAASAYPYTIKAGAAGDFYAFYNYAGWFETRILARTGTPSRAGYCQTCRHLLCLSILLILVICCSAAIKVSTRAKMTAATGTKSML